MHADELRDRWRKKLATTRADRLSVLADDALKVLGDDVPDELETLRTTLAGRAGSAIALRPSQLKQIVDYERKDEPADVPRRRKAKVDDQPDAGAV